MSMASFFGVLLLSSRYTTREVLPSKTAGVPQTGRMISASNLKNQIRFQLFKPHLTNTLHG